MSIADIKAARIEKLDVGAKKAEWWRGAVIYQVYPRSFRDTSGDGVGDLKGVCAGLDHIADLGVDGIWLSPFFTSPMCDFGYDVADYRGVDPIFGSLDDFDAVVKKAHKLGLKVLIDQVYSHTSDQHAWFKESKVDTSNPKADWYVWADPKADGSPPNNWQSVFGGGAWEWNSRRQQYYLHNFLASQPDLNLHNPDVQDALLDVAKFWLDRGVDGFRLDAINFAMHDLQLRDNPPASRAGRLLTRPFDYQLHKYNQSHPDIPKFLERVRALTDEYDGVFTVAEIGGPEPLEEMKAFTRGNNRLNSAYDFSFLYADRLTRETFADAVREWSKESDDGWPSWAFSNHDAPRAISRWANENDFSLAAKLYAMILLSLRGNVFIYQGDELGLPQAEVPFEALQDPEAIANWPLTLGRDGARTPIPWRHDSINAGFSTAEKTWLPLDPRHAKYAVDQQKRDPLSVLSFMRSMIHTRKNDQALMYGDLEFVDSDSGALVFKRIYQDEEVLCVFNISKTPANWRPEDGADYKILISVGVEANSGLPAELPALSGYIARKSS